MPSCQTLSCKTRSVGTDFSGAPNAEREASSTAAISPKTWVEICLMALRSSILKTAMGGTTDFTEDTDGGTWERCRALLDSPTWCAESPPQCSQHPSHPWFSFPDLGRWVLVFWKTHWLDRPKIPSDPEYSSFAKRCAANRWDEAVARHGPFTRPVRCRAALFHRNSFLSIFLPSIAEFRVI